MVNKLSTALELKKEERLKAATGFYPFSHIPLYIYNDMECPTSLSECDFMIHCLGQDLQSIQAAMDSKPSKGLESKAYITRTKLFLLNDWRRNHSHQQQLNDLAATVASLQKRIKLLEEKFNA